MNCFDDLIREGRDTDALRLFAQEYYDNRMMGDTRRRLCVRVANENDKLHAELGKYKLALELACEQISDYALPSGTEAMKDKLAAKRYELFLNRAESRRRGNR